MSNIWCLQDAFSKLIIVNMTVLPIYAYSFSEAFLIFIFFSVFGWVCEVAFVGIFSEHKFVNRGMLHEPLCPIYGFGGCTILLLPEQVLASWVILFVSSMILCTVLEYFVSWLLEKIFHTQWWDYSKNKFNLNGRICLLNSILFGVLGLLVVHFIQPYVLKFLAFIGDKWIKYLAEGIFCILVVDIIITVRKLIDFSEALTKMKTVAEMLRDRYKNEEWFHGETIETIMNSVRKRAALMKDENVKDHEKISAVLLEKLEGMQNKNFNLEKMIKKFPTLKSKNYSEGIDLIRNRIQFKSDLGKKNKAKKNEERKS